MGDKKEIKEAMEQLRELLKVFNTLLFLKNCDIGNKEEFLNDNLKALEMAIECLKQEFHSEKAEIITVKGIYEYEKPLLYGDSLEGYRSEEMSQEQAIQGMLNELKKSGAIRFKKLQNGRAILIRAEIEVVKRNHIVTI